MSNFAKNLYINFVNLDDYRDLVISVGLMIIIYLWQQLASKYKARKQRDKRPEPVLEKIYSPVQEVVESRPDPKVEYKPFENPELEGSRAVETPVVAVDNREAVAARRARRRRLAQTIVAGEILRPRFRTFDEI